MGIEKHSGSAKNIPRQALQPVPESRENVIQMEAIQKRVHAIKQVPTPKTLAPIPPPQPTKLYQPPQQEESIFNLGNI